MSYPGRRSEGDKYMYLHDMIRRDFTSKYLFDSNGERNCLIYQRHIPICNEIEMTNRIKPSSIHPATRGSCRGSPSELVPS